MARLPLGAVMTLKPSTSSIPVVVLGPLSEMAKSYELGAAIHITRDEDEPVVVGEDV